MVNREERHGDRRRCEYPDCPARDSEDDIAGKDLVKSVEDRVIKLEGHHDDDLADVYARINAVDEKLDRKFSWIIGIGIAQLALFVVTTVTNHLNK